MRLGRVNKILASLPQSAQKWTQLLEPVTLRSGMILSEPDVPIDHVYFLGDALVSLISTSAEGSTIEIGVIGHEGMVGVPSILGGVSPYQAVVQIGGHAQRLQRHLMDAEFRKNPVLRDLLLKYTNSFLIQVAQSSICNCYHPLQERLCRWILVARDAAQSDRLEVTHDLMARLLGTRRASVTVAAGLLQRAGLIKTGRGQLTVTDRPGLEAMSCECYSIVREAVRRIQST